MIVGFKEVHISTVVAGDTIEHYGVVKTVCASDIGKTDGFMGTTVFGDSYCMGYKPVLKAIFNRVLPVKG